MSLDPSMSEPIKPEWVSVLPDYANLTVSYEGYQKMMISFVVILILILVIVGVVGWWLSSSYQLVQVYNPQKTIQRIRNRPPAETVEVVGPDLSQSVVLYRGSLPKEWWHATTFADIVNAPLGKCSYIPFIIEGMINPYSHTLIFSTHPFGAQEGKSVLKSHRLGYPLKGYGVDKFPTRRGVWVMPLS